MSGASAGATNRRCDCSSPYRTTAIPYITICADMIASMVEPTSMMSPREQPFRSPPTSASMIGRAPSAISADSGTISSTIQVSSADPIRATCSRSPRSAGPARTGTTMLASAPPATIS
ncbi:Uncharacterised protein [Mycobacterium tuberculosis]|nr:Uncharacterised protein [Mycobacterium tuberculosis]